MNVWMIIAIAALVLAVVVLLLAMPQLRRYLRIKQM